MTLNDAGYVFVYGTLKVGGGLAVDLDDYRIGHKPATIEGSLYKGPFPLLKLDGKGKVHGELHRYVNFQEVLDIMDQMEGYNPRSKSKSLYIRRKVEVTLDKKKYKAYVYEFSGYNGEMSIKQFKRIKSGKWELPKDTTFDENWREENEEMES